MHCSVVALLLAVVSTAAVSANPTSTTLTTAAASNLSTGDCSIAAECSSSADAGTIDGSAPSLDLRGLTPVDDTIISMLQNEIQAAEEALPACNAKLSNLTLQLDHDIAVEKRTFLLYQEALKNRAPEATVRELRDKDIELRQQITKDQQRKVDQQNHCGGLQSRLLKLQTELRKAQQGGLTPRNLMPRNVTPANETIVNIFQHNVDLAQATLGACNDKLHNLTLQANIDRTAYTHAAEEYASGTTANAPQETRNELREQLAKALEQFITAEQAAAAQQQECAQLQVDLEQRQSDLVQGTQALKALQSQLCPRDLTPRDVTPANATCNATAISILQRQIKALQDAQAPCGQQVGQLTAQIQEASKLYRLLGIQIDEGFSTGTSYHDMQPVLKDQDTNVQQLIQYKSALAKVQGECSVYASRQTQLQLELRQVQQTQLTPRDLMPRDVTPANDTALSVLQRKLTAVQEAQASCDAKLGPLKEEATRADALYRHAYQTTLSAVSLRKPVSSVLTVLQEVDRFMQRLTPANQALAKQQGECSIFASQQVQLQMEVQQQLHHTGLVARDAMPADATAANATAISVLQRQIDDLQPAQSACKNRVLQATAVTQRANTLYLHWVTQRNQTIEMGNPIFFLKPVLEREDQSLQVARTNERELAKLQGQCGVYDVQLVLLHMQIQQLQEKQLTPRDLTPRDSMPAITTAANATAVSVLQRQINILEEAQAPCDSKMYQLRMEAIRADSFYRHQVTITNIAIETRKPASDIQQLRKQEATASQRATQADQDLAKKQGECGVYGGVLEQMQMELRQLQQTPLTGRDSTLHDLTPRDSTPGPANTTMVQILRHDVSHTEEALAGCEDKLQDDALYERVSRAAAEHAQEQLNAMVANITSHPSDPVPPTLVVLRKRRDNTRQIEVRAQQGLAKQKAECDALDARLSKLKTELQQAQDGK